MNQTSKTINLIGAGLNGPLLGIFLAKRGFPGEIYERRSDMRKVRMDAGRSISLALSTRGIHALQTAGLCQEIGKIVVPLRGRIMHSSQTTLAFQPYGLAETRLL